MSLRPASLAEVATIAATCDDVDFAMAIDEFADEFYGEQDSRTRQGMLDPVPDVVGVPRRDAWIGAVGEHMALRWGLTVPEWTERDGHFRLYQAEYSPDRRSRRASLFIHSPPAFRRRMLFVSVEPLQRATFPSGVRATSPLKPPSERCYLDET